MIEFKVLIGNSKGMHARASAKFVEVVESFDSKCEVSKDDMTVSGNSIMGLLMLAASKGTYIKIRIWGTDSDLLADAIRVLIRNNFGEDS